MVVRLVAEGEGGETGQGVEVQHVVAVPAQLAGLLGIGEQDVAQRLFAALDHAQ